LVGGGVSPLAIFGIGVVTAPGIWWLVFLAVDHAEAFFHRRRKYAAGYFARTMDARLEAGKHISARPLLSTRPIRGRAYLLTLFKEGPKEPTAEERVREPTPFTEPLDDEDVA
jgi:hypothetical protein